MNKKIVFVFAVMVSALMLAAGSANAKQMTLGYVAADLAQPYNVAVAQGFKDAARRAHVRAVVIDSRGSVEAQANAIDDLLVQGVSGIAMLPLDSVLAETWVQRIAKQSIPVVAVATQVGDPSKRPMKDVYPELNALVTTNDILAGKRSGELAAKLLRKNRVAKIGIVEGAPGYAVVRQREAGFEQGLRESGIKYKIVASQPTNWSVSEGESVCQNIVTANPGIDLIFAEADDMAVGCARALEASGSDAKLVATAGGSHIGNMAIRLGELDGSVCTRPRLLGKLAFKALYDAATGKNTNKAQFITYPLITITKKNVGKCKADW